MPYVQPQTQIFQEFTQRSNPQGDQMYAHLAGGHAMLLRLSDEDEKKLASLGQYDPDAQQSYSWPERPAGGQVDQSYTKVLLENALLHYYNDPEADTETPISTDQGHANRVVADGLVFSSANGYTHSSVFRDRGVKIGDTARAQATVGATTYETVAKVAGFAASELGLAATVGTPTADAGNQASQAASGSDVTQVQGTPKNCVALDDAGPTNYNPDGLLPLTDTFTITVTKGSTGGDFDSAKLDITSASGLQDEFNVSPINDQFLIASGGVQLGFDDGSSTPGEACYDDAVAAGLAPLDLIEGQQWTVTLSATYNAPDSLTTSGLYQGDVDDTYIVEVVQGAVTAFDGDISDEPAKTWPTVVVRTASGRDGTAPFMITPTGTAPDPVIPVKLGSSGVTLNIGMSATAAIHAATGDKFYVPVTASTPGAYDTLLLDRNLHPTVVAAPDTQVTLDLYMPADVYLPEKKASAGSNWTMSDTELVVNPGAVATDSSWVLNDVETEMPVATLGDSTKMYVEARYWLKDLADGVRVVSTTADLETQVSGPLHPDNPLKYGLLKAIQNANGAGIRYTAVCDPDDIDEWSAALSYADPRNDCRNLVPLTRDPAVWSLYQAHVTALSSPELARWRRMWISGSVADELAVLDESLSSDGNLVRAIVEDDPNTSGTQYTYLTVPTGNSMFSSAGVKAADVVRIGYQTTNQGVTTYDEYIVDEVVNEDTLRLVTGPDAEITVAEKIEVWRTLTNNDKAAHLAKTDGYTDRRVSYVWPQEAVADGHVVPGYFICAALAGLASGVVPHQGLTRLAVSGFTSLLGIDDFTQDQLNTMAGGGVHLLVEEPGTGTIYSRHAVTTADTDDLLAREEMIVRNVDSLSYFMYMVYDPYIGISNVVDSVIEALSSETKTAVKTLQSSNIVPRLGAQLRDGDLISVRQHELLKDRIVIDVVLTVPAPLNSIEAHLQIVA